MSAGDQSASPRFSRRSLLARSAALGTAAALASSQAQALAKGGSHRSGVLPSARVVAAHGLHPADLSLVQAAALLRARRLSSRELTKACLHRIQRRDAPVNAWIRVYAARALAAADSADRRLKGSGSSLPRSLLVGLPIGLKDIYAVRGELLTASSEILADNRADTNSRAWFRLRRAGAVLVGHTQTHEFAAGNFTPQSANPWDRSRTPGGSSGGSAIALAARMIPAATGSDTFGSLRIPASFCGLTTIKPTLGLVPTSGLIPLAESFDTAGPIARSAKDVALLLSYMAPRLGDGRLYLRRPRQGRKPLAGKRIGIPDQTFGGLEPEPAIAARVEAFADELQGLGAKLVPFTAPRSQADNLSSPDGFRFFLEVPCAEVDRYHRQWFPQRIDDYSQDVATLLTLARAANTPAHDPEPGRQAIATLREAWLQAFAAARLDAVLQPAALIEPPDRDDAPMRTQTIGDPMVVWNYTGFPAMCLPAGPSKASGLPVGVQLIGRPGTDRKLLRIGIDAQHHHHHHRLHPAAYR
jgi:aspartyl-tRNA(Asn)/glutamyl-tRNA(Gln) amidotransferase subunit A